MLGAFGLARSCRLCVLVAALTAGAALAARGDGVSHRPVVLDPQNPGRVAFGALVYRGGLALHAPSPAFGGVSALEAEAAGGDLIAVTDRGHWARIRPIHRLGRLADASIGAPAPLAGIDVQDKDERDAEGLASDGAGGFLVSFERRHRVLAYPRARPPFSAAPRELALPDDIVNLRSNRGLEAITRTCDGRLLLIAQRGRDGATGAWIGAEGAWRVFPYPRSDSHPAAAATLPDCSILVLERRETEEGFRVRLVRLGRAALDAEAPAVEELASLAPPLATDNFEGIATQTSGAGETLIYLVSDNGFAEDRPTLLLMFALAP
jgi:hypothetical protein